MITTILGLLVICIGGPVVLLLIVTVMTATFGWRRKRNLPRIDQDA